MCTRYPHVNQALYCGQSSVRSVDTRHIEDHFRRCILAFLSFNSNMSATLRAQFTPLKQPLFMNETTPVVCWTRSGGAECLPCIETGCPSAELDGDDYCNVCWTESLLSAPCVKVYLGVHNRRRPNMDGPCMMRINARLMLLLSREPSEIDVKTTSPASISVLL